MVEGVRGVYRSDDFGGTWTRINDDQHQWGLILQGAGDPRIYGRVYVGTHGRGVVYGDPRPKEQSRFYVPDTDLDWLPVGRPPHGGGHK